MQIDNKKKLIILIILIIGIIIALIIYITSQNNNNEISLDSLVSGNENIAENINNEINNQSGNQLVNEIDKTEEIIIHIVGEVKKQGVVHLKQGDRIIDAIEKAGGETKNADLSQINLAYKLEDGQKIYIPNKNEKIDEYITTSNGNNIMNENNNETKERKENKVNINTANQSELDSLPGIGPSIAQRIIEYREENGNFKRIEDLQNVKGIGDAKFSDIKDNVTV